MMPEELKTMPKGHFILAKTGQHPMQTELPLFLKWGIRFDTEYEAPTRAVKKVSYVDRLALEQEIMRRKEALEDSEEDDDGREERPRMPLRTD